MGKPTISLVISTLLSFLLLVAVVNGVLTSPGGSKICNVEITDLAGCLPAITGNSPPKPTQGCCKVIGQVNMPCLCKYKPQLRGLGVNPASAMALPKRCGFKTPPPKC